MAKKSQQQKLNSIVVRLLKHFKPDDILHEMSVECEQYSAAGDTEAEVEYWLKCSRAMSNLSSGTEKWFDEAVEEELEE